MKLIFLGVQNCSFHETAISENTERGNLELTRYSSRKEKCMKRKICQQIKGTLKYKAKLTFWAEVFFCLTWDQVFYVFFLQSIAIQSNHLLGNSPYTLTKRLLASLTDLWFVFGFCLACKNGFESVYITFHLNTGQIQQLCCLALILASYRLYLESR